MDTHNLSISTFVKNKNSEKTLFTAGPASLLKENLTGLMPCFGRGDDDYLEMENLVCKQIMDISGHTMIARMQGSGSLALEIMARNFLLGRVLIISTGYYSERLKFMAMSAAKTEGLISVVEELEYEKIENFSQDFDWIWACSTETSVGLKIPIKLLSDLAKRCNARLMLDATASIGLENDHGLADAISFSSCKGLFGLTGASFITFNESPHCKVDSFYLNLRSHLEKRMTGPYHAIASLSNVLPNHKKFRQSVVNNKKRFCKIMEKFLTVDNKMQPLLCTHVSCNLTASNQRVVLYSPRNDIGGSVVCHIGEVHLGEESKGDIIDSLMVTE